MTTRTKDCQECGTAFTPGKAHGKFCSVPCRKAFNNRRMQRGAMLYDLFMAGRYQRAANPTYMTTMAQVGTWWREEDTKERAGRTSWNDDPERDALTIVSHQQFRRSETADTTAEMEG